MLNSAELVDSPDGLFAMQLNFTTRGQRLMEELTTYYRDRGFFIVAAQSDSSQTNGVNSRCIGAAYIRQTIQAESMQFTPDAERPRWSVWWNYLIKRYNDSRVLGHRFSCRVNGVQAAPCSPCQ